MPSRDLLVLLVFVVVVTLLHYTTSPEFYYRHVVYQHLYYIPILLGAVWYGLRGGVVLSLGVSILYFPHIVLHWNNLPQYRLVQLVSLVLFNLFAVLAGSLIDRLHAEREGHKATAEELQRAYAQLQATFEKLRLVDRLEALGALSAGMAHEIRNPLGSISGAVEILESGVPEGDPRREFVMILKKEIQRLSSIVSRHLEMVRPAAPERAPGDLLEIVRSVHSLTAKQAATQGVTVQVESTRPPPPVMLDSQQIRQAILNLAINAIQALPGGGLVTLRVESDADESRVVVEDDGPGLSREALRRAFEPFYTTKERGTGLGLSIAFQIAAAHGGELQAANREAGGARFTLKIPVEASPGTSNPGATPFLPGAALPPSAGGGTDR